MILANSFDYETVNFKTEKFRHLSKITEDFPIRHNSAVISDFFLLFTSKLTI